MANSDIYELEQLEAMGIFELRTIARAVGMKSPTTAKKAGLIQGILDIQAGKMEPNDLSSKRGRPPKNIKLISDREGNITVKDMNEDNDEDKEVTSDEVESKNDATPTSKSGYVEVKSDKDDRKNRNNNRNTPKNNNPNKDEQSDKVEDDEDEEIPANGKYAEREGWLEILVDGYGFLRAVNCENSKDDTYISQKLIKALGLRKGDHVVAETRILRDNKQPAATRILKVNGMNPLEMRRRPNFDDLVPIYPNERLKLENPNKARNEFAIRCIDLIAPIGKGQRAMIVSPPKAGKTTLLKMIANSITENYKDVEMYVLLVDERPEEVTDMQRSITGTVIYSTFDETPEHHAKSAELLIERAKRSVELGRDVVIIMDSLTRLARAYNLTIPPTGRTLSGGIDPGALHSPKRFFGAARNIENGGSLTIIATALVDTGSRMDDVIYEEFKGTGNMEIHLDRKLSEKRIFPAIDINKSGTRREDLLLSAKEQTGVISLRRMLADGESEEATEMFIRRLVKTKNNNDLIDEINKELFFLEKGGYKKA